MNAAAIRAELDKATQLDAEAREHRRRAGIMLRDGISAAGGLQNVTATLRQIGLDSRMVELLLLMAPRHSPHP